MLNGSAREDCVIQLLNSAYLMSGERVANYVYLCAIQELLHFKVASSVEGGNIRVHHTARLVMSNYLMSLDVVSQ